MTDALRLYGRLVAVSLRAQMQYRASFLMAAAGHFLITVLDFFALWALFARFGSLPGWTLPEVAVLYGMINVSFAIAEAGARSFDTFGHMVRDGEFDRVLLRPRSTVLQLAGRELQLMRLGRLSQGLLVLLWALTQLPTPPGPAQLVLLLAAIGGGACLFAGLFVLQATMAFWTVETLELVNTVTYGGVETGQYPLSIYGRWFRWFFTIVVPLAGANYLPGLAILARPIPGGWPGLLCWLAPLSGVAFLAIALQAWRFGVRHYLSTGS